MVSVLSDMRSDTEPGSQHQPTETFQIPGTGSELVLERAPEGRLIRLMAAGRIYAEERNGVMILGDGLAEISEADLPSGLLRRVHTDIDTWVEEYLWNADRKPTSVDGVRIERDAQGRITACRSAAGDGGNDWRYGYAGSQLTIIEGPFGTRSIVRAADGRPLRVRENGRIRDLQYASDGQRSDAVELPAYYHRDPLGRLWTIKDAKGRIVTTYLWNGLACFGRIDGPPGAPIAALFSLDPTGTPVRIITRQSVTRIPRDGFGETLFQHAGVPGLYGGTIHKDLVYLRSRNLDPRAASFTALDPLCGTERDPRRVFGFDGPLFVDNAEYGPYAVCQNDPLGRTDPTGEFSVPLLLSSTTWAWGNNVFSMLVMDATINFWLSLFNFEGRDNLRGRFWDIEGLMASDHVGTWAFRRDGFWSKEDPLQAWTFQHLCYAVPEEFDKLRHARLFNPNDRFQPSLYGTLLKVVPGGEKRAFLLRGSYNTTDNTAAGAPAEASTVLWGRHGGKAEPTIPGSRIPRFPAGGFHFGERTNIDGPLDSTLIEAAPATVSTGVLKNKVTISSSGDVSALAVGDVVFYTHWNNTVTIYTLTAIDGEGLHAEPSYIVPLPAPTALVSPPLLRLRAVETAPISTEPLSTATDFASRRQNDRLNLPAAGPDYALGDPLRFTQSGLELGAGLVTAFEVQLRLDRAIDTTLTPSPDLTVSVGIADGAIAPIAAKTVLDTTDPKANPSSIDFSPADAPKPTAPQISLAGTITLTPAAGTPTVIPVVLTPTATPKVMLADRPLDALGATGAAVSWQQFKPDAVLGKRTGAPESTNSLTYTPDKPRTASPGAGFVWVEDSGHKISLRTVAGKAYDALVLSAAVMGNTGIPYTVDRMAFRTGDTAVDISPVNLSFKQDIALDTPADLSGVTAFQLFRVTTGKWEDSLGDRLFTNIPVGDRIAATPLPAANLPDRPTPGQLLVLRQGGTLKLGVVKEVRVSLTIDHKIEVIRAGDGTFEAAPLNLYKARHDGLVLDVRQIVVQPTLTTIDDAGVATTVLAAIPLYHPGERVNVSWTGGRDTYVVVDLEGPTLVLDPATGADLIAGSLNLVVEREDRPATYEYEAERVDGTTITVLPTDRANRFAGTASGRMQMPLFRAGDMILVDWAGPQAGSRRYRVAKVEGTTLTITDNASIPDDAVQLSVTRFEIADPGNGTSRIGLRGSAINLDPGSTPQTGLTDLLKFAVWQPSDFRAGKLIAIVENGQSHAVLITDAFVSLFEIEFTEPHGLTGTADILALNITDQGFAAAAPTQPDDHTTASFINEPILTQPGAGRVLLVQYAEASRIDGKLQAGTQRVPNEITLEELDRHQALVDHELMHTRQSLEWGPLLFCYFPVWMLEFAGDLFTEQNLPKFSPFVQGTVHPDDSRRLLEVADTPEVKIKDEDRVEISTGGKAILYKLGKKEDGKFPLVNPLHNTDEFVTLKEAKQVFVRRMQGNEFWMWFMDAHRWTTIGGMTKFGFGGTWGGLALGIGKLVYFILRKLGMQDTTYHAVVDPSFQHLDMAESDLAKFRDVAFVRIKHGDDIRIREVADRQGRTLTLKTPIEFSGDVSVAAFSNRNMFNNWDWNSYYPATIPDSNRPARIKVAPIGTDVLKLRMFDRVIVTDETTSRTCYVTSVEADGTADLNQAPFATTPEPDHVFQVATSGVESNSPITNLLNPLHANWMRYLIDPWGQFKPDAIRRGLKADTAGGKFLTGMFDFFRYGLSTESWGLLPFFGYFWWDHVFNGKASAKSYLSEMEQGASENSGNIYSYLSRMPFVPINVGDVGQFWFFMHSGDDYALDTTLLDSPGVHALPRARISPLREDSGGDRDQTPNFGMETPVASINTAGFVLADIFTAKNADRPNTATETNPVSWQPSEIAWIPTGNALQCAVANYVAFTSPGTHRVTIRNVSTADNDFEARSGEAQNTKKHTLGIFERDDPVQTVLFDVVVLDIIVTIAGMPVANGDRVRLLRRQRAPILINGGDDTKYEARLVRPDTGVSLRQGASPRELAAQDTNTGAPEPAAIARVYPFHVDTGKFDDDVLSGFGMHLAEENLAIQVRDFEVEVIDHPAVVRAAPETVTKDLYDAAAPELHPNETVLVLVPVPVKEWSEATYEYPLPPPAGTPDPSAAIQPLDDLSSISASVKTFLGVDGRIFSVALAATPTPVGDPFLIFTITVGTGSDTSILTVRIPVRA